MGLRRERRKNEVDEGKEILDADEFLLLKRVIIARIKPAIERNIKEPAGEAEALAVRLAQEADALDEFRREAVQVSVPANYIDDLEIQRGNVGDAIDALVDTFREVSEIPEVKRAQKSRTRKFSQRVRVLLKRNKKKIKNKKAALENAIRTLNESINLRRRLLIVIRSLGKKLRDRRKVLIGLGTAAAALTAGDLLFKKEEIPANNRRLDIELPFVEPNFGTVTIPEVNKTIYTEGKYRNAKYIFVIPHSTELNALDAARAVGNGPITWIDDPEHLRNLIINYKGKKFSIDPNNAFCLPGMMKCFNKYNGDWDKTSPDVKEYIQAAVKKFCNETSKRIFRGIMVLALHQNTNEGSTKIENYTTGDSAENVTDLNINSKEDHDVFAFVNSRGWFEVLKGEGWNVVLQKNDPSIDSGSIAYAATWEKLPYVNLEVQAGDARKQIQMLETVNRFIDRYPQLATDMNYIPPKGWIIVQDPIIIGNNRKALTLEYAKFHYGLETYELKNPLAIVVHSTNSSDYKSSHNTFYPENLHGREDIKEGGDVNLSAHFIIDRNGKIYQQAPLNFMCRHVIGYNHISIGIENVSTPKELMTDVQIEANAWLISKLVDDIPTIALLFPHKEYANIPQSLLIKSIGNPSYTPANHPKIDPYGNDFQKIFRFLPGRIINALEERKNRIFSALNAQNGELVMDDPEIIKFMETMTPEEKAAQMIISYHGFVSRHSIGGVILNQHSMRGELITKALIKSQSMFSKIPMLFGADQEGGLVNRLQNISGFKKLPSAFEMGKMENSKIGEVQQRVARSMRNMGLNANFAPCLDITTDSRSIQGILKRSFGPSSAVVMEKARAFSKPFCNENIALFAKHFPGYGDLRTNTDNQIVQYNISMPELNNFMEVYGAMADCLSGIMMCSAIYTAADNLPAVLSPKIIRMARKLIGNDKVIITDDIVSVGMRRYMEIETAIEKAISAGNDVILTMSATQVPIIIRNVSSLYATNEIYRTRINESVYRILKLKKKLYPGFLGTVAPAAEAKIAKNILIIGSDKWAGREGMGERGDSLIVVSTDQSTNAVNVLSIPRDTYVNINGKKDKINHALTYGGWQLQKSVVEEFLGIIIDKVFFIDGDNLKSLVYVARYETGDTHIIQDVYSKIGFSTGMDITFEKVFTYVTNRKLPGSAVERAKNHARLIGACIQTMIEYYNEPNKSHLFERDMINRFLMMVKHTELNYEDILEITKEWGTKRYNVKIFCIPGKSQGIKGVSYWVSENIPGSNNYFTRVINNTMSRIV